MTNCVDILLYVALSEEADSVLEVLGSQFQPKELEDANLTSFFGTLPGPSPDRDFKVAMVPAGKMGNTHSASVVSLLIEKFKPVDVVVIGIAGSLSNDMEPGDVFIPDSINEYLANSAAYGEEDDWKFQISTNRFQTSRRLLNRFQFFALTKKNQYQSWQDSTFKMRSALISTETDTALKSAGLGMRGVCKLYAGNDLNLASGPAVGKGKAFTDWIKREVDRKAAAIEMETAGVYDAALIPTSAPRTIAIRGISDYADARKEKIETTAEGMFRELSAKNAVSLFVHAVKAGLFEAEDSNAVTSSAVSDPERLGSWARSVFVIGGETGETTDVDAERPRLHRASLKLGAALARGGAHLIVCSPFPDSADYYVAMGYSDQNSGGIIHFHSPIHQKIEDKRALFRKLHGKPNLTVLDWNYPTPETDAPECWSQAWLLAQLQALEKADVVVALGGKISKNASTLLHLAEAKSLPIIPFAFLGGAASRTYQRRNWADLNPGFDAAILDSEDKVEQVVAIANRLVSDRVKRSIASSDRPKSIFISVARQDAGMGAALEGVLKNHGIEAVLGDNEIDSSQMITATIENALRRSDIVAVLWSRSYAQSPWCYDELALALSLEALGEMKVWLFNLDDSSIVPTSARKFPAISVRNIGGLQRSIEELLS
ncbi:phosphorylase family protein [Citrobacter freundii]|uniref:phosphorylase family protein n=1 Tax=Citrobacter freundii TaxID=546 RepID=UPI00101DC8C5|nr:TIR domain-containing protein [Citrobacter freundii]RYH33894.1 TIR domain-containing protein [Citrobacter freundii]HEI9931157.1 TIR domain-containing protein [Citrobacter freundii]